MWWQRIVCVLYLCLYNVCHCVCIIFVFVIVLVLSCICPCLCIVQPPKANGGVFGRESCSRKAASCPPYSPGQWASPSLIVSSWLSAWRVELSEFPIKMYSRLHWWRRQGVEEGEDAVILAVCLI